MSENKCSGCCGKKINELNGEELNKVTGGKGWKDGKFLCEETYCLKRGTVDGVKGVCLCDGKTNGKCCFQYGTKCNCPDYSRTAHVCLAVNE